MKSACSVEACDSDAFARTWCRMHYARWFRSGTVELRRETVRERLLRMSQETTSGCRVWTARLDRQGYGVMAPNGRGSHTKAHRVAYVEYVGPIPEGLVLDHLCRNRACINPEHLEAVSQGVNVLRGDSPAAVNAKKVVCANGHALPARTGPGSRKCKVCDRDRHRAFSRRMRGEQ